MTREILFRGNQGYNGEWVYGDLIRYESGETAILNRFSRYGYEATEICRRIKVLPETVGQFTGLTDKNGKKIFEGDIVVIQTADNAGNINGFTGIVVYNDGSFDLQNDDSIFEGLCFYEEDDFEIIGNIHDNPELLEGEQ